MRSEFKGEAAGEGEEPAERLDVGDGLDYVGSLLWMKGFLVEYVILGQVVVEGGAEFQIKPPDPVVETSPGVKSQREAPVLLCPSVFRIREADTPTGRGNRGTLAGDIAWSYTR